jgi:M6 family metalloprotease-like protein
MIPSRIKSLGRTLGAILSSFVVTLVISSSMSAAEPTAAANVRNLNNASLRLLDQSHKASATEKALLKTQAAALLKKRATALQALIKSDPKRALTFAFSPELLAEFTKEFPTSTLALEQHGKWQGTVEYRIYDDFAKKTHRSEILLDVGGRKLEVRFAGAEPNGLKSGDTLEVSGVQSGVLIAGSDGGVQATSLTAASCSVKGEQSIAVLLVTFPGVNPPAALTSAAANDLFFDQNGRSLNTFWQEASYRQTWASGDVFGWYTLDRNYTCSEMDSARDAAIAMATAQGADFTKYSRVFVVYPNGNGCTTGFASVGCASFNSPSGPVNASTAYVTASYLVDRDQGVELTTHEGGHNLGLLHSGTMDFGSEALGAPGSAGTVAEMGDWFSTMGAWTETLYSAPHKALVLSWMNSGTNYQTVTGTGSYTLQPLEVSPAGLQALRVQRPGTDQWLWLEYRQPIGQFDSTLPADMFTGALIHYEDASTGSYTRLLDFTPETTSWFDPPLPVGRTWIDPYTNLSLNVNSASPSGLQVNVSYGASVCTRGKPTITMTPSDPSAVPGNNVGYTVSITNNDSSTCGASSFNLTSTQPSGWGAVFTSTNLTLTPGQSSASTLMMSVPTGTPAGTYPVSSIATASSSASASANCTVVSSSTLAVSVSIPQTAYARRSSVVVTAKTTNGGATTGGASVTVSITKPNGSTVVKKLATDSTGTATWNYRISNKDPVGVYSVNAQATQGGQTANSEVVTFSVQ